jgi:hypothetical protein
METHWLILLLLGLLLLWGVSLGLVRYWTRRWLLKELLAQDWTKEEGPPPFKSPRSEDQAALELIRATRRQYLLKLWPGTEFSFKIINEMSLKLLREIAGIYHPEEERPELKASLADLVALHNRVGARLAAWLETFPVRAFKDVELKTVLRYHELYQNLRLHPGYQFIKRHHLDRVVRWGWSVYNYANPWHWGRKAALEGSKEVAARLLLARIADFVGEEAMLLYGRH